MREIDDSALFWRIFLYKNISHFFTQIYCSILSIVYCSLNSFRELHYSYASSDTECQKNRWKSLVRILCNVYRMSQNQWITLLKKKKKMVLIDRCLSNTAPMYLNTFSDTVAGNDVLASKHRAVTVVNPDLRRAARARGYLKNAEAGSNTIRRGRHWQAHISSAVQSVQRVARIRVEYAG